MPFRVNCICILRGFRTYGQQVVDHDLDERKPLERIDTNHPEQVVLIRQVREEPEPILFLRSPRLVR